jgi:hypothetical protein
VVSQLVARKTYAGPLIDIGRYVGSDKTGRNEAACGRDSRMAKGMDVVKNKHSWASLLRDTVTRYRY